MFLAFTIILTLVLFIVNMFSGGGSPRTTREIFYGRYYAEDAVTSDEDIPNSRRAIENCVESGLGIKTEAWLSKDKKVMISAKKEVEGHEDVNINETDSEKLQELGVFTLTEYIDIIEGQVPLIVEIKSGDDNEVTCRRTADAITASGYNNIAVASFQPGIIAWFKSKARNIFRGLISAPSKDFIALSAYEKFMTGNLANNSVCRPQFVLYRNKKESALAKFAMSLGLIKGTWTAASLRAGKELEQTKDMIVFRGFMPETPQFKVLAAREKTQIELDAERKAEARMERRFAKMQYKAERKAEKEQKKK